MWMGEDSANAKQELQVGFLAHSKKKRVGFLASTAYENS